MDANTTPPPDANLTLRDHVGQIIKAAAKPVAVGDVKKALKERRVPLGGKDGFKDDAIEDAIKEAVADGSAHEHPAGKGKVKYWHTRPKTAAEEVADALRAKVQALGEDEVVADKKLGKPSGKKATPETTQAFDDTLNELLNSGQLHRHGKNFGKKRPPTVAEQTVRMVKEKVAGLADDAVVAEGKLGKPAAKAPPEAKQAFEETLRTLLEQKQLFRHGKNYGKQPPPPPKWYEIEPAKKPFEALVKAAKKVLDLNPAPADDVFALLRERLKPTPPPPAAEKPALTPPPVVEPPSATEPVPPPPAPVADLRVVLKQAYDHLCEFVEFRDKLVELPRLYREAAKQVPNLTPEAFQAELWEMGKERVIELHVINDERAATHPELGIRRNDSLYYYARWN